MTRPRKNSPEPDLKWSEAEPGMVIVDTGVGGKEGEVFRNQIIGDRMGHHYLGKDGRSYGYEEWLDEKPGRRGWHEKQTAFEESVADALEEYAED